MPRKSAVVLDHFSNGVHDLDLETGSSASVTGALTASSNAVYGINVNGSSIAFSRA
jgi:hypothetical protein